MLSSLLFRRLMVLVPVFAFAFVAPVQADDVDIHATVEQVHGLLKQALGGDTDITPPNPQRKESLKQAKELLVGLPPARYHGHRGKAIGLIDAALEKIDGGDVADTAKQDIRDADYEVRELE